MKKIDLVSDYQAAGDQPVAIETLIDGINNKAKHQTLLGVTGSGKTFTMAKVIERTNKTTLIMAPNKTLAAQLYSQMRDFFQSERFIPEFIPISLQVFTCLATKCNQYLIFYI